VVHRATSLLERREGEQMKLNPGGIVAWIVVGLIAGWLADRFVKGGGYGMEPRTPASLDPCVDKRASA
jgi:F0F1-type ATP synthase assembly protein I